MALEFKLPDIGEGVAEGEVVKWLVKVGDAVEEHQSVVEVMTDKATVEVPAPRTGTITSLNANEGDVIPVGQVLFTLEESGAAAGAPAAAKVEATPVAAAASSAAAPAASSSVGAGSPSRGPGSTGSTTQTTGTLEFQLPDIGEGVAEGEIVKWLVQEGDQVAEHQSVVEVMTDKATVEVPAPADGKVLSLLAAEGETVPVGKVIFKLATIGSAVGAVAASPQAHQAPATVPAPAPALAAATPARQANGKVLAVPSARRVARELGIDLSLVNGSGRNGVIRRADVESFASGSSAVETHAVSPAAAAPARPSFPPVSVPAGQRETRQPFRGVRRKIAEAMTRSAFTAVHFTVVEEVDVTDLVALRQRAKELGAQSGVKITYMPFIMKAVALGLAKYPQMNGRLDEEKQELIHYGYVNLGIATDTPNGLIVPVLPEVQAKGIMQLAVELAEMAERTRTGKVRPEELKGSTFSITNAGNIGGTLATPIINFPDIAILGVHRIRKAPGVVETSEGDRIEVRQYMNLSCSVDHRLADGADGARFLVYLKELLENPGLLAL